MRYFTWYVSKRQFWKEKESIRYRYLLRNWLLWMEGGFEKLIKKSILRGWRISASIGVEDEKQKALCSFYPLERFTKEKREGAGTVAVVKIEERYSSVAPNEVFLGWKSTDGKSWKWYAGQWVLFEPIAVSGLLP